MVDDKGIGLEEALSGVPLRTLEDCRAAAMVIQTAFQDGTNLGMRFELAEGTLARRLEEAQGHIDIIHEGSDSHNMSAHQHVALCDAIDGYRLLTTGNLGNGYDGTEVERISKMSSPDAIIISLKMAGAVDEHGEPQYYKLVNPNTYKKGPDGNRLEGNALTENIS